MLFFTKLNAQDEIALPDSLGKYLYEMFINRVDIRKSEVLISNNEYYNPKNIWTPLLEFADKYKLNSQNTFFYNTFFSAQMNIRNDKADTFPYTLYIAMQSQDKIYAFCTEALYTEKGWMIMNMQPEIYAYTESDEMEFEFEPLINAEVISHSEDYLF